MIEAIIAAVTAIFKAIPYFDKWFSKSSIEKEEKAKDEVRDQFEKLRKNAPPDTAP